jgi:hypothetical protein
MMPTESSVDKRMKKFKHVDVSAGQRPGRNCVELNSVEACSVVSVQRSLYADSQNCSVSQDGPQI